MSPSNVVGRQHYFYEKLFNFIFVDIQQQINKTVENLQHLVTQARKLHEEENSGETKVKAYDGQNTDRTQTDQNQEGYKSDKHNDDDCKYKKNKH